MGGAYRIGPSQDSQGCSPIGKADKVVLMNTHELVICMSLGFDFIPMFFFWPAVTCPSGFSAHNDSCFKVIDDPNCECGEKETIEHVLCHCPKLGEVRRRVMEEPVQLHHLVSESEKCGQILAKRFEGLKFKHW